MSQITCFRAGLQPDTPPSKEVHGGKGYGLIQMGALGINVPPGFVIPTQYSVQYMNVIGASEVDALVDEVRTLINQGVQFLTEQFGYMPLVSVRSGARVSMPGMMDTILNVGLTSKTLPKWIKMLGKRAAMDSYRRLIQMYASTALGVPMEKFEAILAQARQEAKVAFDSELNDKQITKVAQDYLAMLDGMSIVFPDTVEDQLLQSVLTVFSSWQNPRAQEYRKIHNIPGDWGTAVTIQSMVFGNLNDKSCTGVVFTRDPSTGDHAMTGEFLVNAQGEDVVAGIRTPEPIAKLWDWNKEVGAQLEETLVKLETNYSDMQDVEFTVSDGTLYILQTRSGKRAPQAALKIAHDMAQQGLISRAEAVKRITAEQVLYVMRDRIDPKFTTPPHLIGIAAGGSVVRGQAVFTSEDAVASKVPCILVRKETDPDDIGGMNASVGILTSTGGLTSHAAVVARGMNKACVVGCTSLVVQNDSIAAITNGDGKFVMNITPGTMLTLDGASGNVWVDTEVPLIKGGASDHVRELCSWAFQDSHILADLDPDMQAQDMLGVLNSLKGKSVAIDLRLLGLQASTRLFDLPMDDLIEVMQSFKSLCIHLGGDSIAYDPLATSLHSMFGVSCKTEAKIVQGKVAANLKLWPQKLIERTILSGITSQSLLQEMTNEGFQVTRQVATVEDVLQATGPLFVDTDTLVEVFGSNAAYQTLLDMVAKYTGKAVPPAPAPRHWYSAVLQGD